MINKKMEDIYAQARTYFILSELFFLIEAE